MHSQRLVSCRSVISLDNSQNTRSTSTPRTIVFGSLGPFPLPVEEIASAKKQKTAFGHVAAPTPKATIKKPKAHEASTCKEPGLSQDLVPKTFTKTKQVQNIYKASPSQGELVLPSLLHERGETCPLLNKINLARARLLLQAQNQIIHHKASRRTCQGLHSCSSTLHLNRGRT